MITMMVIMYDADDDLDVGDDDSEIGDDDDRWCYLLDGFEISSALNPKNIITTTGSAEYIDYDIIDIIDNVNMYHYEIHCKLSNTSRKR